MTHITRLSSSLPLAGAIALAAVSVPVDRSGATPDAVGRGWGSFLTCVGCVAAGTAIVAGGPGAIIVATSTPGSTLAAAGCAVACYETIFGD